MISEVSSFATEHGVPDKVLIGLIGADIQRSKSPYLHEQEAAELGFKLHYQLIDLSRIGKGVVVCAHSRVRGEVPGNRVESVERAREAEEREGSIRRHHRFERVVRDAWGQCARVGIEGVLRNERILVHAHRLSTKRQGAQGEGSVGVVDDHNSRGGAGERRSRVEEVAIGGIPRAQLGGLNIGATT